MEIDRQKVYVRSLECSLGRVISRYGIFWNVFPNKQYLLTYSRVFSRDMRESCSHCKVAPMTKLLRFPSRELRCTRELLSMIFFAVVVCTCECTTYLMLNMCYTVISVVKYRFGGYLQLLCTFVIVLFLLRPYCLFALSLFALLVTICA